MNTLSFLDIFHPADFSKANEGAFAHALKIGLAAKAKLTILHVEEPNNQVRWKKFPHARKTLARWGILSEEASLKEVEKLGLHVKKVERIGTDPGKEILNYVGEHAPGLIVLATHQRKGMSRWMHTALAEPIARQTHVMTLFVPRGQPGFISSEDGSVHLQNILIPVAKEPRPQGALEAAATLASILECQRVHFTILYVGPEEAIPTLNFRPPPGWTIGSVAREGNVVDQILAAREECHADLIAMATQGHKGFLDAVRGSTTERVLREAKCPLLAIPAS